MNEDSTKSKFVHNLTFKFIAVLLLVLVVWWIGVGTVIIPSTRKHFVASFEKLTDDSNNVLTELNSRNVRGTHELLKKTLSKTVKSQKEDLADIPFELYRGKETEIKEAILQKGSDMEKRIERNIELISESLLEQRKQELEEIRTKFLAEQARQSRIFTNEIRNKIILYIALVALTLVLPLTLLIHKLLSQPIRRLTEGTNRVSQGDLSHRVDIVSNDELGELGRHFNTMVEELNHKTTSVENLNREIKNREKAEYHEASERERLAVTLRSIGDSVITTDREGKVVLFNRQSEKLTGYTLGEARGRRFEQIFHIIDEKSRKRCDNPVEKVIKTGSIVGLANNTLLIARDGRELVITNSGAPIRDRESNITGVVLVFHDVTEQRKREEELFKTHKLESVGILAGGIAHDFNNILTAILGNITLAKMSLDPDDESFKRLSEAEKASIRAQSLTQQLLAFSKGGASVKKTAAIKGLIVDTATFALRGSNMSCDISIPDNLWSVEVDEGQISQVIHNLIINADNATPNGGTITVEAGNLDEGASPLTGCKCVMITIKDHGVGIPEEHLQRIFDPYFSTKQKGSGLGLASCYSIIKNHNGHIAVDSKVSAGTTFTIYVPASQNKVLEKEQSKEVTIAGKGRVLLMDDEASIRELAGEILTHFGYEVSFAEDGREAIELYKKAEERGESFDIVVLDLTVPGGLGGRDTIMELKEIAPELKAIVSSGYSDSHIMSDYKKYGFRGVIAKPYTVDEFGRVVAKVITG